jgi:hypothetical protein
MRRPVRSLPMNAMTSTPSCLTRRSPAFGPSPSTMFTTPGGRPAKHVSTSARDASGVFSEGFQTTVLPTDEIRDHVADARSERVVPRHDAGGHTARLAVLEHELAFRRALVSAAQVHAQLGKRQQHVDRRVHLAGRLRQRLAVLDRQEPGELGQALTHPIGHRPQRVPPRDGRQPCPSRLGLARRSHGGIDVIGRSLRYRVDHRLGRRIDDCDLTARVARNSAIFDPARLHAKLSSRGLRAPDLARSSPQPECIGNH